MITRLAKIGELRVISRTSTQRYKTRPSNLGEIARELGVSHLVEGTVQRIGDRVRINVQLIRAANEGHLWAEIYDRNLTDIFAVQTELATSIASSLQASLSGAERKAVAEKPTSNLAAYESYLRGIDYFSRPGQTKENQTKAAESYAEAVRLDPQFAQAWAALSQAHASLYFLQYGIVGNQDKFFYTIRPRSGKRPPVPPRGWPLASPLLHSRRSWPTPTSVITSNAITMAHDFFSKGSNGKSRATAKL